MKALLSDLKTKDSIDMKVILVVGSKGLLGAGLVSYLLENGYKVISADCSLDNEKISENLCHVHLDITSESSINAALEFGRTEFEQVDGIVNCAYPRNSSYGKPILDVTYENFNENVSMHLGGYFACANIYAKYCRDQKIEGNIIYIASIYGVIAPRFEIYENTKMTVPVEYAAIKSALIHLAKYQSKAYEEFGVRVNCVSPGGILDGQDPQFLDRYNQQCRSKGMLEKEDIYGSIDFLLSEKSRYVNGQNIVVDDGFTV